MTASFIPRIKVNCIGSIDKMHTTGKIGIWGLKEEMVVIGHESKCVKINRIFKSCFRNAVKEFTVIYAIVKDYSAEISPGGYMVKTVFSLYA